MTQIPENPEKVAEFRELFLKLNEKEQDAALAVLYSAAQSRTFCTNPEGSRSCPGNGV